LEYSNKEGFISYIETSAKTGTNIDQAFNEIVKHFDSLGENTKEKDVVQKIEEKKITTTSGGCCG
jgi:hypothetical protein